MHVITKLKNIIAIQFREGCSLEENERTGRCESGETLRSAASGMKKKKERRRRQETGAIIF